MNPLDYGTREVCEKLFKAGIVLETEAVWFYGTNGKWHLGEGWLAQHAADKYPAVSMSEVWRELPQEYTDDELVGSLMLWKEDKFTAVGYWWHDQCRISVRNLNPTNALIALRIWLEERKEGT